MTVFLINGVKLQGVISSFDNFCLLLRRDGHVQLVYKHAVSTVMPSAAVRLYDPASEEQQQPQVDLPRTHHPRLTARPPTARSRLGPVARSRPVASVPARPPSRLAEAVGLGARDRHGRRARRIGTLAPEGAGDPVRLGKAKEFATALEIEPAELVVVDAALSPVQQRNLERLWKTKVIDRTGLILEIFGERAHTREGVLQVELASLTYQRSRLVRSWTHLERQRGGFGFLGGPGESQLELDRRRITERIVRIKEELAGVRRTRGLHREARKRVPYPVVALVGYTNAGKSTLFNRLTGAGVDARDQLFATLDPTMRQLDLPSRAQSSCPTRSASSPTCRPRWWPPSAPRWKRCSRPI